MSSACSLCQLLLAVENDPTFIAEFEHSVAFLNSDQDAYRGRAMLVLKAHHEHWHLVPIATQQKIIEEGNHLTAAILKAFGGRRANHMSLGNQVPHVHWHIIPRYPGDLNAGNAPIHSPMQNKLSDRQYQEIAADVRTALR